VELSRIGGSVVVNSRFKARTIELDAGVEVITGQNEMRLASLREIEEFKRIMTQPDKFLRVMPENSYTIINAAASITGWTAEDDTTGVALDTSEYQLDGSSISFNATVATSTANQVAISTTSNSAQNVSTILTSPNRPLYRPAWEFWVYIPDVFWVYNLGIRIGSSVTNYLEFPTITQNYNGEPLKSGWNFISIPHEAMTSVGTPAFGSIGSYIRLRVSYKPTTPDQTGFRFGGLFLTRDADVRNYKCYLDGQIDIDPDAWRQISVGGNLRLLNYSGYGESTHLETLASVSNATTSTQVISVNARGNTEQNPIISINYDSVTSIDGVKIENITTGESIQINRTFATGNVLTMDADKESLTVNQSEVDWGSGSLLTLTPGVNTLRVTQLGASAQIIAQELQTGEEFSFLNLFPTSRRFIYQSFTTGAAGTLDSVDMYIRGDLNGCQVLILADNAGDPGSTIDSFTLTASNQSEFSWVRANLNASLAAATRYWIAIIPPAFGQIYWGKSNTDVLANGSAKAFDGTFSNISGDMTFRANLSGSFSAQYDVTVSAKRKYV
jgi:hypothetical protein